MAATRSPPARDPLVRLKDVIVGAVDGAAGPAVPVEWWGVRRAWDEDDKKVLDRGVAAG